MKILLLLTPLLFVACAPRAILLVDAGPGGARKQTSGSVASNSSSTAVPTPPARRGDELGLLEPRSIADIPDEREMRPTVDPDEKPAVIATPPTSE